MLSILDDDLRIKLISFIDFTRLQENDLVEHVQQFCHQATTPYGAVAAVCVYPRYVKVTQLALQKTPIKIATVINFPEGNQDIHRCVSDIHEAIKEGANEIDLVLPYVSFLKNESLFCLHFIQHCKEACGPDVLLKVILETGALKSPSLIEQATLLAIEGGADFIKTSTGKISTGATLEAAEIILKTIASTLKKVGFKASGGIQTPEQAFSYFTLAQRILGESWPTPYTFRLGVSQLLSNLLKPE